MVDSDDIEILRSKIRETVDGLQEFDAWHQLLKHSDLEFKDLLNALESWSICSNASLNLHVFLGIPIRNRQPILDRHYWEKVLSKKGITSSTKVCVWKGSVDNKSE